MIIDWSKAVQLELMLKGGYAKGRKAIKKTKKVCKEIANVPYMIQLILDFNRKLTLKEAAKRAIKRALIQIVRICIGKQ